MSAATEWRVVKNITGICGSLAQLVVPCGSVNNELLLSDPILKGVLLD